MGQRERQPVDAADRSGFPTAGSDETPVAGERVPQRNERVEHEARMPQGGQRAPERDEEVPGVAHDDRVDVQVRAVLREQARVCRGHARGEPRGAGGRRHLRRRERRQRRLELVDGHAVESQAVDQHGVARIGRVVRAEVRDGAGHCGSATPGATPAGVPAASAGTIPGAVAAGSGVSAAGVDAPDSTLRATAPPSTIRAT